MNENRWEQLELEIIKCRRCPRLVEWREKIARQRKRAFVDWNYWGKPVPGFGDRDAEVLIVGLAPGAHGSNRTGRMFTGDASGNFLYRALYHAGFANQSLSVHVGDDLRLQNLYISAVCRCVPPKNKPAHAEIINCLDYLQCEMNLLANMKVIVALGRIAFDTIVKMYAKRDLNPFYHGSINALGDPFPWLVASYHPSQQNTQTGRLTEFMFNDVWEKVKYILSR